MHWASLTDFAEMGGHALYVWGAYLVLFGALAWELVLLLHRRRRALDDARQHALLFGPDPDSAQNVPNR
ncbi:MAG: heme exporter protein CcmD [Rhizobacter sp.]|nr:heme exporter protein CcmD [Rhizobacter sp.]